MLRFRFLLLCLLMWTVPFQGIAAVSMQFCVAGMSHASHIEGSEDHHAASDQHINNDSSHASANVQKTLPDVAHKCGVCAACCSAAVISSILHTTGVVALPSVKLLEPQVLVYAVPQRLLERPPRA